MDKENKKHHCDCGCEEHHHDNCEHEHCDCCEDEEIVELTADDGRKLKFYFVGTIEYKGKNYSAFEPAEKIDGIKVLVVNDHQIFLSKIKVLEATLPPTF